MPIRIPVHGPAQKYLLCNVYVALFSYSGSGSSVPSILEEADARTKSLARGSRAFNETSRSGPGCSKTGMRRAARRTKRRDKHAPFMGDDCEERGDEAGRGPAECVDIHAHPCARPPDVPAFPPRSTARTVCEAPCTRPRDGPQTREDDGRVCGGRAVCDNCEDETLCAAIRASQRCVTPNIICLCPTDHVPTLRAGCCRLGKIDIMGLLRHRLASARADS